ncbi:MAG TPA: cytochrome c [Desulfosporosinus sp.]
MNLRSTQKSFILFVSCIVLPLALSGCGSGTAQTNPSSQPSNGYTSSTSSVSKPADSAQATGDPAVARGLSVFNTQCIGCHGTNGSGGKAPTLIGKTPAASFIQSNMPKNKPGSLSSAQASDLVAYITSLK